MIDARDPPLFEDRRQVSGVTVNDLKLGDMLKTREQDSSEVGVALEHDNPAIGMSLLREDLCDRSGPCSQLDHHAGLPPVDGLYRRARKPSAARSQTRNRGPVAEKLGKEQRAIVHDHRRSSKHELVSRFHFSQSIQNAVR